MICVSVGEEKWEKALPVIEKYGFTEIRIDYLEESSSSIIEKLFSGKGQKIATFRKTDLSNDSARLNAIETAVKCGADYVDADIENSESFIESVIKIASKSNTKVIISYHNYEATPSLTELEGIIKRARQLKCDIVKIACMTETDEEAERLLSLPSDYENIVIAGMGSKGERVRTLSAFAGSLFTYASPDSGKAVAPGQIPFTELYEKQKRCRDEW
jgi:3-dehydroquinate dehydratase type I